MRNEREADVVVARDEPQLFKRLGNVAMATDRVGLEVV